MDLPYLPSDLEWSPTRPDRYGHYWLWEGDGPPVVVLIAPWTLGAASTDLLKVVWFVGLECSSPIDSIDGLWAGPIPAPPVLPGEALC